MDYLLSIDQGTSGTKALIINTEGVVIAKGGSELYSSYPKEGFVEQDPEDIYRNVITAVKKCLESIPSLEDAQKIRSCGISNQRETFLLWDRDGTPCSNAIVWQCKRSIDICGELLDREFGETITEKTGLIIDPYFSATKLLWLLRNDRQVAESASRGELLFGTVDTWLLYRLTGGKEYKTDYTNASRTLLFNIHTLTWDEELKNIFQAQNIRFPEVHRSADSFGSTDFNGLLEKPVPINAMIGDSHAAAFGERCFSAGSAKSTLGTGSSFLMNIGKKPIRSKNGMMSTICYADRTNIYYALEGIIVSCGSPIKWMKDNLGLIGTSSETEGLALEVEDAGGVKLIPAFSGMGAPYWKMNSRGAITGLTFGSDRRHIVRAALDAIAYQIKDIISAMEEDSSTRVTRLSFDGGITANGYVMQTIADLLGIPVRTIGIEDVSAVGAALLAGLGNGIWEDTDDIASLRISEKVIQPSADTEKQHAGYRAWRQEVLNVL